MSSDVIDRLVRPANPVPNPRMLVAVEVSTFSEQERNEMKQQVIDTRPRAEKARRSPGRMLGIAAAVAAVLAVFVMVQTRGNNFVAAATPTEIATEYLEAYAAFDVERVASMLADDAEVLPWEASEPRDWQRDLEFLDAAGFQILVGECKELSPLADSARVNCEYQAHGLGSDQIGLGPFGGHVFRLLIANGRVTRSFMGFNFSEFGDEMWWPFQAWIEENHPEDFEVLYVRDNLSNQTDEAIALWEQRVEDYVAFVNSQP